MISNPYTFRFVRLSLSRSYFTSKWSRARGAAIFLSIITSSPYSVIPLFRYSAIPLFRYSVFRVLVIPTNEVGSEYRIVHSTIQYSTIVHNVNQSYITLVQIVRLPGPYDLSTTCADPQSMLWLVFIQWAFRTSPVDTALLCLLILVFKGRPVSLM